MASPPTAGAAWTPLNELSLRDKLAVPHDMQVKCFILLCIQEGRSATEGELYDNEV
jgi:hypothetical protein